MRVSPLSVYTFSLGARGVQRGRQIRTEYERLATGGRSPWSRSRYTCVLVPSSSSKAKAKSENTPRPPCLLSNHRGGIRKIAQKNNQRNDAYYFRQGKESKGKIFRSREWMVTVADAARSDSAWGRSSARAKQ